MKKSLFTLGILLSIPYNILVTGSNMNTIVSRSESFTIIGKYDHQPQITLRSNLLKPCSESSAKSYMERSAITDETSEQHAFIEENMEAINGHWVDKEGYIGVALGSWFGEIGTRWIFELDSGIKLYTVKIEHKADIHTINGCQHIVDGSVIEFVIDSETNPYWIGSNGYIANGNFNNLEHFKGNIISVRKEKKD